MFQLPRTQDVIKNARYCSTADEFFGNFASAWDAVRCQVAKLETRQQYDEAGNPAYVEMTKGNFSKSMEILTEAKKADQPLYDSIKERHVDFIRCRPLKFPLNTYMKWEMAVYDLNHKMGEQIFCCNYNQIDAVFTEYAQHDFMVFDTRFAFVHHYNDAGSAIGGWVVSSADDIMALLSLFSVIKASCRPYELFRSST